MDKQTTVNSTNNVEEPKDGEFIKKDLGGRPSKYTPDIADKVYQLMAEGKTNIDICSELSIPESTFYRWRKDHKDLQEAYERGLPKCQQKWEEMGKAIMLGQIPKANATVYMAFMNNKFNGWARDKVEDKGSTTINIEQVQVLQSLQQLNTDELQRKIDQLTNRIAEDTGEE